MVRKNGLKKARVAAAVLAAVMTMSSAMPVMAANYSSSNVTAGTTTQFDKYLVMSEGANVPNAEFSYTITGAGNAKAYDVAGRKVAILDGVGTPTITWDSHGAQNSTVKFQPGDATTVYRDHLSDGTILTTELVKDLEEGKKYAKHTATVDFSGVTFPEPGVYRYKIEEMDTTQQAITNDGNLIRYLDVYITDDGNGKLGVEGYVLHSSAADLPMNATNGTEGGDSQKDNKSQGYTNNYETHDLVFSKNVSGNQASHDKYFKFHVKIENAVAGTVYDVSLRDDSNANTTDGNAEESPTANAATVYSAMANVTQLTVGTNGTIEQDFYLQHGQSIAIRGIAKDSKYTVTETEEDYKPSATADEGTVDAAGNKVTVDKVAIDNTAAFVNTRSGVIPTGVIVSVLPFGIAAVLAGTSFAAFRSKKEEDDEE